MDPATPIPLEVIGWSMAPWLKPGDLLLVEEGATPRLGDVVCLRNRETGDTIVHRLVGTTEGTPPFRTKGDRNRENDPLTPSWELRGVVRRRHREGRWNDLRFGKILWLLSVSGLYPGQRIPLWMSRDSIRKGLGLGGA